MTDDSNDARDAQPGIIKVIGIGQSLRGDDGAGLEAVRLWHTTYQAGCQRPEVQMALAELPGIDLLNLLEGSRVAILVDAVYASSAAPGTIHVLPENEIAAFAPGSDSAHGWGVSETLALGQRLMPSCMPQKLVLIGIGVRQISLGEALSPEVRSALPAAARLIEQNILDETQPG